MADTHSIASSRASSASTKQKMAMTFFSQTVPIFPFFSALQAHYPTSLVWIGLIVGVLQMLAFVINPRLPHGESLTAIAPIVYTAHLPFWDPLFSGAQLTFNQYLGPLIVGYILVYVTALSMVAFLFSGAPIQAETPHFMIWRLVIHSITSVLYIPLLQGFLSQVVCGWDGTGLWTLTGQACNTGTAEVTFILSIIGIVILVIMTFLAQSCLFRHDPESLHLLARAHANFDYIMVAWKTLSCILFHVLLADKQTFSWLPMYIFFSCGLLACATAFLLPYYHHSTNRFFTSAALVTSGAGLLVYLSTTESSSGISFTEMDIDGLLFFSCATVVWWIGQWVADARINPELIDTLPHLVDASVPQGPRAQQIFPTGLPVYDMSFQHLRDLCSEVVDQAQDESVRPDNISFGSDDNAVVLCPYLTAVHVDTDVELATRFLRCGEKLAPQAPKTQSLALAIRIFTKGMTRFEDSGVIHVSLSYMISSFAGKASLALQQAERVNRLEATFHVRYHAFKLQTRLKQELNLRDTTYQKIYDQAKKLHKETLMHMQQFWTKLLSQQVDMGQLNALSTIITHRREEGNQTFLRALQYKNNDRMLLTKYAWFLDQVMMESEHADQIRVHTKQEMEERKKNAMRGAKGNSGANQDQGVTDLLAQHSRFSEQRNNGSRTSASRALTFGAAFSLVAIGAGLLIFAFLTLDNRKHSLQCVDKAAQARSLAAEGGLLALQFFAAGGNTSSTQRMSYNESIPLLNAIDAISDDYFALHSAQMVGAEKPFLPQHIDFVRGDFVISEKMFSAVLTDRQFEPSSPFAFGYDIAQFLKVFSPLVQRSTKTNSSVYNASVAELLSAQLTLTNAFDAWVPSALNVTVAHCVTSYRDVSNYSLVILAVLFGASLLVLSGLLFLVSLSVTRVARLKQNILALFPLIPNDTLQRIAQQARERVDSYDEQDQEENIGIPQLVDTSGKHPGGGGDGHHADDLEKSANENSGPANEDALKQRLIAREKNRAKKDEEDDFDERTAILIPDFSFVAFGGFLMLLAGALVLSVLSLVLPETRDDAWDNALDRIELTVHQRDAFVDMIFDSLRTLADGEQTSFSSAVSSWQLTRQRLSKMIAEEPTEKEVLQIRDAALIEPYVTLLIQFYLTNFLANPSGTFAQYTDDATPVPQNAFGTAVKASFATANGVNLQVMNLFLQRVGIEMFGATERAADVVGKGTQTILSSIVVACAGAASILTVFGLWPIFNSNAFIFFSPSMRRLLGVTVFLSLAVLGFHAAMLHEYSTLEDDQNRLVNTYVRQNMTLDTYRLFSRNARQFVVSGDRAVYDQYFDGVALTGGEYGAADVFLSGEPVDPFLLNTFLRYAASQRSLELIAITMMANATNIIDALDVASVQWNFLTQPDAVELRALYPNEPLRYTNRTYDLGLPNWLLRLKAPYTLFSPQYEAVMDNATNSLAAIYNAQIGKLTSSVDDRRDLIQGLNIASIACSSLAFILGTIYIVWTLDSYIHELTQSGRRIRDANNNIVHVSSNEISLKLFAFLVLALLVAAFAIGVASIQTNRNAAKNVDASSSREWLVAQSMFAAEKFRANLSGVQFAQSALTDYGRELRVNREILYFGDTSGGEYNVPGMSKKTDLNTFLFGEDVTLSPEFACGYEPNTSVAIATLLQQGASSAILSWESSVNSLAGTSQWAEVNDAVTVMRNIVSPLLRVVHQSTVMLMTSINDQLTLFHIIFVVLIAVSMAAVIAGFLWIILPLLWQQDTEESGGKLLLRLIPAEVCESVPAIQEFFESELGDSRGGSQGSGGEATDTATIPVIAIDTRGVVLKFNTAAEEIFGYTAAEVIGNNVSILMPEKIGKNHDGYLLNYRRTGVRKVIGFDRQVHARRKSGELFPIELNVKEFKRDNGEFVYIGFCKDITKNLELKKTEELNNLIQEYATVPMIAIDSLGTVLRFNRAAEECFGQQIADVVNQNIKMLMPEEIAARHDSYLAAYLRTREKHIIDTTRSVQGLRKSGEVFPLEISVKEITTSDFGAMSTYLGFCRDLTQDIILDEANRINDEITDLSPVPIVGIDPYGKVLKFSRAACEMFGYEHAEVLDRNVKMLMPEAVAEVHDGYLEAYRQTGKKRIVGTEREVFVQRKDGTQIPMLALIREVKKEGSSTGTFVGYLVSLGEEKLNAKFKAIDDVIVDMHPVPLVTMNAIGTINRVNKALLYEFGFRREEVVDKNVKMLMPPEVAVVHDGYLKRYTETRVAHIIGSSRRVYGRRKNGNTFPVEVMVEEVIDADGKSTYIGFLRNLVHDLGLEQQFLINQTNLEISPTPMIGIDPMGTIKIFSKAAEECWKISAAQAVGQNVKLLMAKYIADQHDLYLERYRKTGVKNVIGAIRVAEGMDTTGRVFPVELSVREIIKDDGTRFYIAYCRDMTRDGETQQVIYRNSQISDLSPIPLLHMDLYGVVQLFNAAAEQEFGWKREEVLGRNVKMLLPDEIAKSHDHYLAQYRKTRVKSVIGSLRRTRGKRKDNSTFAVEIAVNEVVVEGDPEKNSYIGYVRDITEELRLTKANEVSGVISDLSPNPLVAINKKGDVITFNRAACAAFRYSDASLILGQNVKMLMPEEISIRHDGFLIAYSKTGQKHVIDTTRAVKAKRSDGTTFPAEISVREISKQGKESTFLSYIRDCTEEVQMAHATQVSDAIQSLSSIPMIIIDPIGTIKRVNQVTVTLFGFNNDTEIIGKNIKILMPEHIAINHDGYLRNYLRTGVKNVIDTTRAVEGKRVNGAVFPAEVSVREVKTDTETIYIGYLRDLTSAKQVEQARAVNDAIASSSVLPLIVINGKGTVHMFVPAAEDFFGYRASEVLGKNIKMLMPQEISDQHDGFLSEYARTRVKHVIDSTRVTSARLKSGDTKPISITVKEVPSKTGEGTNFVGYVVDLSNQFSVARAVKIAESVREMMTTSIISITEEGMIRQFNRAAELFFGYRADDVLGKNVKMLMPPEVSRNHDGYLDTYRRTKVKHVIGSMRIVQGLHSSGDLLDVELHVSEFMLNGKSNYIAYATDRRTELDLQRSAMINEALVSLSLVPIVAIDSKNRISRFSTAAENEFGYKASEVLGENVRMLMPQDVSDAHDGYLDRYRRLGHTYTSSVLDTQTELVAQRRDGSQFPAELVVKEIKKEGQTSSFVGYIRNIEADLVFRSNALLCSTIESLLPDPIIVINQIGTVQSFTPAASKLFQFTKEQVLGQNIKMLMPMETAEQHDGFLKRYLSTGVKRVVDTTRNVVGRKSNGATFNLELRVKELLSNGKSYFIGYCRDTSADYDLAIETEVGEALMELNPDAIVTIDPKGAIIKFNHQAEVLFQFERRHIIGRNVKVLMPDEVASRHDMFLSNYLKTGVKRIIDTKRTVTAEKKTGETFLAEVSVREVRDDAGKPQYFLGYIREVTKDQPKPSSNPAR